MTFSLAGRCERTGAVGAVIASASMAVAARCAAVRAGVGAVCSQSTTDPRLRDALLDAMAGGLAAGDALAAVTELAGDIAYRQLAVVDAAGGSACYSGELALGEAAGAAARGPRRRETCWPTGACRPRCWLFLPNGRAIASVTGSSPRWRRAWPRVERHHPFGRLV